MSGSNFPGGSVGPGYTFNYYRSDLRQPGPPVQQQPYHQRMVLPSQRNTFLAGQQMPGTTVSAAYDNSTIGAKQSAPLAPNMTVITSGGVIPATVGGFSNHPAFTNLFQTLLRGATPNNSSIPNLSMTAPNVSGYLNTVATSAGVRFCPQSKIAPNLADSVNLRSVVSKSQVAESGVAVPALTSQQSAPNTVTTVTSNSDEYKVAFYPSTVPSSTVESRPSSVSLAHFETLFQPANMVHSETPASSKSDGRNPPPQKLRSFAFLRWASALTRSSRKNRICAWPRTQADVDALHSMNWAMCAYGLLGIYSDSPFLRPVILLRRVQFACPGNLNSNIPDPDNMVRTLREQADSRVNKHPTFSATSGLSASSIGFATDFLRYMFTLELEAPVVKVLTQQLKASCRRSGGLEWRVVLRLGWATSDFYVPPSADADKNVQYRALAHESLPRCLSVRVGGRIVTLPDPIFHGGQAQRLGKRLRLSIDITDKLPLRAATPVRTRMVDVEINWLHVPMEDHPSELFEHVTTGQFSPIFCHLVSLPLVQITLDRSYSVADLCSTFKQSATVQPPNQAPLLDGSLLSNQPELLQLTRNSDLSKAPVEIGIIGCFDNCLPAARYLPSMDTKMSVKMKLEASADADLAFGDGEVQAANYIPACLLCPLTRTRIEIPVRTVNCEHLQCFDLASYLTINFRRPRWTCPICSSPAPYRDLRLDELFDSILLDSRTADASFVHISADGSWRLAPGENENTTDDKHESPRETNALTTTLHMFLSPSKSATDQPVPSVEKPLTKIKKAEVDTNVNGLAPDEFELIILSDDDTETTTKEGDLTSSVNSFPLPTAVTVAKHEINAGLTPATSAQCPNPGTFEIDLTIDDDDDGRLSSSSSGTNNCSSIAVPLSANHPPPMNSSIGSESETRPVSPKTPVVSIGHPYIIISPLAPLTESEITAEQNSLDDLIDHSSVSTSKSIQNCVNTKDRGGSHFTNMDSEKDTVSSNMPKNTLFETLFLQQKHSMPRVSNSTSSRVSITLKDATTGFKRKLTSDNRLHSSQHPRLDHSLSNTTVTTPFAHSTSLNVEHSSPRWNAEQNGTSVPEHHDLQSSVVSDANGRRRQAPILKQNQSVALARLVQQRSRSTTLSSSVEKSVTVESNSLCSNGSKSSSSTSGQSRNNQELVCTSGHTGRRTKKTVATRQSKPKRSDQLVSDDEFEVNGYSSSDSTPAAVSSDESGEVDHCSTSSSLEEEEDFDDSVESDSSDERWTPSVSKRSRTTVRKPYSGRR